MMTAFGLVLMACPCGLGGLNEAEVDGEDLAKVTGDSKGRWW